MIHFRLWFVASDLSAPRARWRALFRHLKNFTDAAGEVGIVGVGSGQDLQERVQRTAPRAHLIPMQVCAYRR